MRLKPLPTNPSPRLRQKKPMDKLSVYNMALQLCGVSDEIESDTEDSLERRVCDTWYDVARQRMLAAFPWRFARGYETGAVCVRDASHPMPYRVDLPETCLFVRCVYIEGSAMGSGLNDYMGGFETEGLHRLQDSIYKMERVTAWQVSDNAIYALDPIRAYEYTLDRTDIERWPLEKVQLLAYFLAESIAAPLQRNPDAALRLMQLRQTVFNAAVNQDTAQLQDIAL